MVASGYDSLYLIFNSGNGNFDTSSPHIVYLGPSIGYPVVADFNNDGLDDIATASDHIPAVRVFLQAGTETGFAAPGTYPVGPVIKMQHGDFTGDGFEDLVVINLDESSFEVLINAGDGTFGTPQSYTIQMNPYSVVVADVDDDNDLDLIIGNKNITASSIEVYKNEGGVFSLWASYPINVEYLMAEFLSAGDINGDNFTDITYLDWVKGEVNILYNDGAANFGSTATHAIGVQPQSIITDDLNNDGKTDLVISNYNSIQTVYNQGDGLFDIIDIGAGYPTSIVQGDFNNDGSPDLAATNFNSRSISVMINNTQAQFLTKKDFIVGDQPYAIYAADVTGDIFLDLMTANVEEDSITILRGMGNGDFVLHKKYKVGEAPVDIKIVDFNSDGQMDIVVLSRPITLLMNTGSGFLSFEIPGGYTNLHKICTGDLNGDNAADIIFSTDRANRNLNLILNNGDGTFGNIVGLTSQFTEVDAIAISDFNEDGILDIGYKSESYFYVLTNNGDAVFSQSAYSTGLPDGDHIATGDFDGNGKQDVAFGSLISNAVSVLVKDDANGYHDPILVNYPGGYLFSMVALNLDDDAGDDLAIVGWPYNYLTIWTSLPRLLVSTVDVAREYGVDNPPFTGIVEGWTDSNNHGIVFDCSATILSSVGTYDIFPIVPDSIMQKFAVLKNEATLTINPAPLTITAHDTVRRYGQENPLFHSTVTGLRNNDTFPHFLFTDAGTSSPPGEYTITPFPETFNNTNSLNYTVTTVEGKLTIMKEIATAYPNPSNGVFSIYSLESLSYSVLNSSGIEVQRGKLTMGLNEIHLTLTPGIYMIHVENGNSLKIVVN